VRLTVNNRRRGTVYTFVRDILYIAAAFFLIVLAAATKIVYSTVARDITGRAAERNLNATLNTAARLEVSFRSAYADALTLLELNRMNFHGAAGRQTVSSRQIVGFFELHPEFAALVSETGTRFINQAFFKKHNLNEKAIDYYLEAERELMEQTIAAEDGVYTMLPANASPYFGTPLLALFFKTPVDGVFCEASDAAVFVAFFSADIFSRLLEGGVTFVVNIRDDVLLHTDNIIVTGGRNYWQMPLVRQMRTGGETGMSTVFDTGDGKSYFGAFQKLSIAGTAVLCETDGNSVLDALHGAAQKCFFVYGAALAFFIILLLAASVIIKRRAAETLVEQENRILERNRIKSIFCALPGSSKSDPAALEKIPLDGESKDVTVVYAALGISGRKPSPQKTLEALNCALSMIVDSFTKTGGTADTINGEGVTGIWGAPFSEGGAEMDALNAVRGALLLRAALIKRSPDSTDVLESPASLSVSCGISSGKALAGRIGAGERAVYGFTGGAVKRARLIDALNKRFGTDILISESVMKLAGKYFITEELPPVKIRGAKKTIRVFAVINVKVTKSGVEQPKPSNIKELRQLLAGL
jgi:adenylate cyclase